MQAICRFALFIAMHCRRLPKGPVLMHEQMFAMFRRETSGGKGNTPRTSRLGVQTPILFRGIPKKAVPRFLYLCPTPYCGLNGIEGLRAKWALSPNGDGKDKLQMASGDRGARQHLPHRDKCCLFRNFPCTGQCNPQKLSLMRIGFFPAGNFGKGFLLKNLVEFEQGIVSVGAGWQMDASARDSPLHYRFASVEFLKAFQHSDRAIKKTMCCRHHF